MLQIPPCALSAVEISPVCVTENERYSEIALLKGYNLSVDRGHLDIIRGRYEDSREIEISTDADTL